MSTVQRVLHVIPSVGPVRGGPSEMIRHLATGLTRAGLDVHVATTDDNGSGRLPVLHGAPVVLDGVTYWYFPRQARFYTFSWPLNAWLARHIGDFDLVHIHALFSFASVSAAFWARRRGVPYIVRPLGTLSHWGMQHRRPWLKQLSFRFIESRILKHAVLIHYTSEQERSEAESLDIPARATVIPNPISNAPSSSAGGQFGVRYPQVRDQRIILFLSRLDAKKGLDLLLRAFAAVRREVPTAALVIAGSGDAGFVKRLEMDAASLGLQGEVAWVGFLDQALKAEAFADAEMFVLPSYSENFGIAVAEAMMAGLPVIVSDQVGIHEDIELTGAGLVVSCSVEKLTTAILQLLNDKLLAVSMGRHGQALARERYSAEAVTRTVLDTYSLAAN